VSWRKVVCSLCHAQRTASRVPVVHRSSLLLARGA
jgi:hypothetical protein